MYLVISKCVTAVKVSNFTGHYPRNRSTLDIGVLGFFGIVLHKEHPPQVWSVHPVTPCILNWGLRRILYFSFIFILHITVIGLFSRKQEITNEF